MNNACRDFVLKNFENHEIKTYNSTDEYFNKISKQKLKTNIKKFRKKNKKTIITKFKINLKI